MKKSSKEAVKRRENRKRRKAVARKQLGKSRSNGTLEHSRSMELAPWPEEKLSEVIVDYAEPLLESARENNKEEEAIALAVIFWNASLLPKQEAKDSLEPHLANVTKNDVQLECALNETFETMYARKQRLFPHNKRVVVDYLFFPTETGRHFQVISTVV